jgi:hypothetical protein
LNLEVISIALHIDTDTNLSADQKQIYCLFVKRFALDSNDIDQKNWDISPNYVLYNGLALIKQEFWTQELSLRIYYLMRAPLSF